MSTNDKRQLGAACALAGIGFAVTWPGIVLGVAVAVVVVVGGAVAVGRAVQ